MNGGSGRESCSYAHDVSGERFDDVDGERWSCPFESAGPDGRCLFHAPATNVDGTDVVSGLLEALSVADGPVRLLGATLPSLPLEYAVLDGTWNYPIDLREATIEGPFTARNATIRHPLRFEGARFEGPVDLEDATVTQAVRFDGVTATEPVSWYLTTFESWVDVRNATFEAPLDARVSVFHQGIFAVGATFGAAAEFHSTRFRETANFHGATFRSGGMFDSAKFSGSARFSEAVIDAPVIKLASAAGDPNTTGEARTGTALTLEDARCERGIRLDEATLDGDVALRNASLQRALRTDGITVTDGTTVTVDCTGSERITGRFSAASGRVTYDLTDAVVGTIDLVEGSSFGALRFRDTRFDGFDFGEYKSELAAAGWRLHHPEGELDPSRLENLYLHAKNGAKAIGETRAAAEFFVLEMRYRRAGYLDVIRSDESTARKVIATTNWAGNAALDATCGYGERVFRPVLFSVGLIGLFSVLYASIELDLPYTGPQGYVTFSLEAFVSLLLGQPATTGELVSFLVALEGFLGAFMIALFVFTLTRSVSR